MTEGSTRAQFQPFSADLIPGAADVLAARQERHRAALPQVPVGDPRASLHALWQIEGVSGVAALRDGRVAAFVLAQVGDRRHFGHSAWVMHAGHASEDGELLRDVYAAAAQGWVEAGAERHYVLVPAFYEALAPWYRLGFAHMHVEALRPSGGFETATPAGVTIRPGTRADLEIAEEIDLEIFKIQARSPSFTRLPLDREARRADWFETDLKEEGLRYLVAEAGGELLGHTIIFRHEPALGFPENAATLASTAVLEDRRGEGIGLALVAAILRLAAEAGYEHIVTNWRMTNLSASRFWPARGFQPIYHRLQRTIGTG